MEAMASIRTSWDARRHLPMQVTAGFILLSTISAAIRIGWMGVLIPLLILLITLVPAVIETWARVRIPFTLQLQYAVMLLAGPYVGGHLGLYRSWFLYDTLIHLYSGVPVAFGMILLLGVVGQRYRTRAPIWLEPVALLSVKALVALTWEAGEFYLDLFFAADTQADNFDTMTDMIAGTLTAAVIAAMLVLHRANGRFRYIGFLLHYPHEVRRQ